MTDDILKRAVRAYFRRFGGGAPVPTEKSELVTVGGEQIVILRNAGGELARLKMDRGGKLRHASRRLLGELKPLGWSECVDEWPIHADKERRPAGAEGE